MATRLEVQRFLRTFHAKLKVFDILFRDDRGKNQEALFDLDITPVYRVEIIKTLAVMFERSSVKSKSREELFL